MNSAVCHYHIMNLEKGFNRKERGKYKTEVIIRNLINQLNNRHRRILREMIYFRKMKFQNKNRK